MAEDRTPDVGSEADDDNTFTIHVSFRKQVYDYDFDHDAVVTELLDTLEDSLDIPVQNQKIIVPGAPLVTWKTKNPQQPLSDWAGKKLMLIGSNLRTSMAVEAMCARVAKINAAKAAQRKKSKAPRKTRPNAESSQYTFAQVRPLNNLPRPEKSQMLLMRLKNDPGIKRTMAKHKFSVALLTEMEPLSNTQSNHEGTSRILGLNRNKGEVIELRLRTDAYDGYRDYKVIRKTLCHELAHNVHSDHDRNFWDLCHQIEREVAAADYKHGGQTLDETSVYHRNGAVDEEEEAYLADHGGWEGGEFTLGGVRDDEAGMSRREILARAAMQRQKKDDQSEREAEKGWRPCQRHGPRPNEEAE